MSPTNRPPPPDITEDMYNALGRFDELVDQLMEAEKISQTVAIDLVRRTPAGGPLYAHSMSARRERDAAQRSARRGALGDQEPTDDLDEALVIRNTESDERRGLFPK